MAGTIVVLGGGSRKWRYEEEFQELAKLPSLLPEDGLRPLHPDTAISRKLGHVKDKKKKKAVKSDPISSSKQSKPVHVDGVYKVLVAFIPWYSGVQYCHGVPLIPAPAGT